MFFKKKKTDNQDILQQIKERISEVENSKKSINDNDLLTGVETQVQSSSGNENTGKEVLNDINNIVENAIQQNDSDKKSFEENLEDDFLSDMLDDYDNDMMATAHQDNDDDEDLSNYKDINTDQDNTQVVAQDDTNLLSMLHNNPTDNETNIEHNINNTEGEEDVNDDINDDDLLEEESIKEDNAVNVDNQFADDVDLLTNDKQSLSNHDIELESKDMEEILSDDSLQTDNLLDELVSADNNVVENNNERVISNNYNNSLHNNNFNISNRSSQLSQSTKEGVKKSITELIESVKNQVLAEQRSKKELIRKTDAVSNKTIEQFLYDILQPKIVNYLDEHLEGIVHDIVQSEIKKIIKGIDK